MVIVNFGFQSFPFPRCQGIGNDSPRDTAQVNLTVEVRWVKFGWSLEAWNAPKRFGRHCSFRFGPWEKRTTARTARLYSHFCSFLVFFKSITPCLSQLQEHKNYNMCVAEGGFAMLDSWWRGGCPQNAQQQWAIFQRISSFVEHKYYQLLSDCLFGSSWELTMSRWMSPYLCCSKSTSRLFWLNHSLISNSPFFDG